MKTLPLICVFAIALPSAGVAHVLMVDSPLHPDRSSQTTGAGWVLGLTIVMAAVALPGCNGGFALPRSPLAQTKTYTVTVTGTSGTIQHSTHVQISVQTGAT
jgi:hypothetical protein